MRLPTQTARMGKEESRDSPSAFIPTHAKAPTATALGPVSAFSHSHDLFATATSPPNPQPPPHLPLSGHPSNQRLNGWRSRKEQLLLQKSQQRRRRAASLDASHSPLHLEHPFFPQPPLPPPPPPAPAPCQPTATQTLPTPANGNGYHSDADIQLPDALLHRYSATRRLLNSAASDTEADINGNLMKFNSLLPSEARAQSASRTLSLERRNGHWRRLPNSILRLPERHENRPNPEPGPASTRGQLRSFAEQINLLEQLTKAWDGALGGTETKSGKDVKMMSLRPSRIITNLSPYVRQSKAAAAVADSRSLSLSPQPPLPPSQLPSHADSHADSHSDFFTSRMVRFASKDDVLSFGETLQCF